MQVLDQETWQALGAAHQRRVDRYLQPHLARRRAGQPHPVHDFLFTYYSQRPAALRRWHPGYGVALAGPAAAAYSSLKGYAGLPHPSAGEVVGVDPAYVATQRPLVARTRELLAATAARPGNFGCFGLHEWAMVYRMREDQTRHAAWPLRLGHEGTDRVVETQRICCSHFDAYRFFTPPARPLNTLRPGPGDRAAFEQPSCLHATMDLYKHAYRLTPMVGSDLVADCFELAWEVRELDMRASPYDLSDLGFQPVRIETPDGRREYADRQRAFTERAAPLRERLVDRCDRLLAAEPG
ncbi:MAG TPA: 3-methyladenine DNA glycosylase [Nocardioides sp.]|nr:3-methyladenine DNA glycosylase [Nocardioides sp.]